MNAKDALKILKAKDDAINDQFSVLQAVAREVFVDRDSDLAKELVFRTLERRVEFSDMMEVLNAIVREMGLFPYLEPEKLSSPRDIIAYEYHRCSDNESFVFHNEQLPIFNKLLDGKNIILSAPTSFGKSRIVDSVISSGKFKNIVIVVPTLALIDETRRRLYPRFSTEFNVVSHPTQSWADGKNIFIFTPERVVSYSESKHFPKIDLL